MAKYLAQAKEDKKIVESFLNDHPELAKDPRWVQLVYQGLKAMPRVNGVVRRNYMREAFGEHFSIREKTFTKTYGPEAGVGTFQGLEIIPKSE